MNQTFEKLGFYPADILLPRNVDMTKWAVVACDQFTSQPEYWQAVEKTVGDAPSTLRLILPEAKLASPDVDREIAAINGAMERYLTENLFRTLPESLLYIERRAGAPGIDRNGRSGAVRFHPWLRCVDPRDGGNGPLPDPAPGAGPAGRPH